MKDIVIAGYARSPFHFATKGALTKVRPDDLAAHVIKGLVTPRRAGTTRIYTHRERGRLQLILRGKRLGFSLTDIGEYLDLYDADPTQHDQIVLLLDKVNNRIGELESQKADIDDTLKELSSVRAQALAAMDDESAQAAQA